MALNLETVSVVLRPRTTWEAVDLGIALARRHARAVWGSWALCVLPVHALAWLLLGRWPGLAFALLWWLKPLFDRVPLLVLSRALFGEVLAPRQVLRQLRRGLGPHVLRSLTWARPSPLRAMLLPIWQLEGLPGRELSRRARVLGRGADSGALGVLSGAGILEACLSLAGVGMVMLFAPDDLGMDSSSLLADLAAGRAPLWLTISSALTWTLATSLVEPLFVAGGFGLCINRRTWLEGWDIELQFRRLANRLGAAVALLLVCLVGAAHAQDTGAPDAQVVLQAQVEQARSSAGAPVDPAPLTAARDEVMALPEMPHKSTSETWGFKEDKEALDFGGFPTLGPLGGLLALLLKGLVILVVVALVALLIRALLRMKVADTPEEDEPGEPQRALPALLREAEPLPEDVVNGALALWRAGRRSEALGVLYRGALRDLVLHRALAIPDGATESDCLRQVRGQLGTDEGRYFTTLTRVWQAAAYAHLLPDDEAAMPLFEQWARYFRQVP